MQTKSIVLVNALAAATSAAALPQSSSSAWPTLSGPNWYDWTPTTIATSAAVVVATSSQTPWGQWTPSSAAAVVSSTTNWGAVWTPSSAVAVASSTTNWGAVWTPSTPAAVVSTTSSYKYENPFTVYTTQTNQWGVITGMPSVVTSQPAVVTSQPSQPVPAGWTTSSVARYQNTTTLSTATSSAGFQQTKTASASIATKTGNAAAALQRLTGAGMAIIALGCGFSLL